MILKNYTFLIINQHCALKKSLTLHIHSAGNNRCSPLLKRSCSR